jgi:cytochrome c oxidase subunit 1
VEADNYLTHGRGVKSWLFTLDHKRIAVMYMVAVLGSVLLGGIFAMLVRMELFHPGPDLVKDPARAWELYNHMFTIHGAVMVFMVIIPGTPAVIGNFVLPLMLGAKDVAFPRLNLLSFHLYCLGALFFVYVLLSGVLPLPGGFGLDTGWTFYTPYSTGRSAGAVVPAVLGAFIMGFSSILTGVNFVASIHMLRPKGMTWFRMPLFLWATYATSIIQILATPVLGITLLLLAAEKTFGVGIFDSRLGGDPVLFQHFFWFYSHPAVYIMILPAMGVISEMVSVFSRKHIFGYNFIAYSSIAIALLSFLVWGHHMFVSGQSPLGNAIFSLLTFSVSIPSAIKVFNWLATMQGGSIRLKTPMLYVIIFLLLFAIGGLTGLFLGSLATDVYLTDTYFVVAHFHYVMMGSALFAFIGALYYWWPKMFGRMVNETVGAVAAVLVFVGFNLTFFVQFLAGTKGMPRRYASYPVHANSMRLWDVLTFHTDGKVVDFQLYHQISTVGAFVLGMGLFLVLFNWLHSLRWGKIAPANPWGANTLEWRTPSPPPHDNFAVTPEADDPYDLRPWRYEAGIGGWVRDESAMRPVSS